MCEGEREGKKGRGRWQKEKTDRGTKRVLDTVWSAVCSEWYVFSQVVQLIIVRHPGGGRWCESARMIKVGMWHKHRTWHRHPLSPFSQTSKICCLLVWSLPALHFLTWVISSSEFHLFLKSNHISKMSAHLSHYNFLHSGVKDLIIFEMYGSETLRLAYKKGAFIEVNGFFCSPKDPSSC